ncbi:unnamed protein product [Acanthoscelides obtectus]|uniref:Uncharacterized protein n=1 Tax=Acanthoscelides obtectus TaxID=200917 RepID=A0A9P0PSP7_ACAOB|nr:unnamed protein product [Acanthoscelides obtectus]CAK1664345.1 hypothetical protein AOBTE_LOCUS24211 [Acanthoscelides obtectus]
MMDSVVRRACLPRYFRGYARCVNTTERRFSMYIVTISACCFGVKRFMTKIVVN